MIYAPSLRPTFRVLAIAFLLILAGCGRTVDIKRSIEPLGTYPPASPIQARIQLVLEGPFDNYVRVLTNFAQNTARFQYGDVLSRSAEALARSMFSSVSVARAGGSIPPDGIDAVLTPKLIARQEMIEGVSSEIHMLIEWSLVGRDGSIIWKQTVHGVGEKGRDAEATAIRDVFLKSHKEFVDSPEIRSAFERQARN